MKGFEALEADLRAAGKIKEANRMKDAGDLNDQFNILGRVVEQYAGYSSEFHHATAIAVATGLISQ